MNNNGRFVNGGTTEMNGRSLGWWERKTIPRAIDDLYITIDATLDRRPDLIAKRYLGSETRMWLVLQYNNIVDIETELTVGTTIVLPSPKRSVDLISSK
jgi:hypothetical protein